MLTQVELAKRANIKQASLSAIELGQTTTLKASTLMRLASALECSPLWLQTGRGDADISKAIISTNHADLVANYDKLTEQNKMAIQATINALINSQKS